MALLFRAVGVSTTPARVAGQFSAVVRFVRVDDGTVPPTIRRLSEQTFTVATRAELQTAVLLQLQTLKAAHTAAERAIDIVGKTLAEINV